MWRAKCLATRPTRHQNKYWLKRLRGCWAFSGFIWTQIYMELNWINAKIWCTLLHLHFFMNNLHITQFLWHHQCNWLGCNSFAKWLKQIARKWSFFTGTWWYPQCTEEPRYKIQRVSWSRGVVLHINASIDESCMVWDCTVHIYNNSNI